MSAFLAELVQEGLVRIVSYKAERDRLLKAQERIQELEKMIAEAEAHVEELKAKCGSTDAG